MFRSAQGVETNDPVFATRRLDLCLSNESWAAAVVVRSGLAHEQKAAAATGIGQLGTHSLRHTYRSWLDSVGTPVGVQQKLMRHADIRTTMNVYGDAATDEMTQAHSKVVGLALNGAQTERKAS